MKSLSLLLGVAGMMLGSVGALAGTVTVSTADGSQIVNKDGLVLQNGYAVRVGSFNLPDATRNHTLAITSDYAQLKSWFKPLAEGVAGAGTASQVNGAGLMLRVNGYPSAGNVFGLISNISNSYMPAGTPLYLWIFNNANPDNADQWGIFTGATWVAPQSLGAQTLSSSAAVTALQGTVSSTQLGLVVPKPCFGNWSAKAFAAGTSAAQTAATANPSGDGIANLAKYAWGLDPNSHSTPPTSLTGTTSNGGATFTFLSPKTLPDVQVSAECSLDLKTWSATPSTVVSSNANFDTCQCTIPTGATKCFWRVRIVSITPQ